MNGDDDDEDLTAHARRTDPDTSHEAAASLSSDHLRQSQLEVLSILRTYGPITDDDLVGYLPKMSPSGARTRRCELVALGKVHKVGKAMLKSGNKAALWDAKA